MPRQRARTSLMGAPTPSLMSAEAGTPTLMAGGPVVLTVYQGDDKRWLFRLSKTGGGSFDLTGYDAALEFRLDVADVPGIPVTPIVDVTDELGGEITVTLPSEESVKLTSSTYVWDLEIIDTRVTPHWTTTIAVGTLVVTKEVTRTVGT